MSVNQQSRFNNVFIEWQSAFYISNFWLTRTDAHSEVVQTFQDNERFYNNGILPINSESIYNLLVSRFSDLVSEDKQILGHSRRSEKLIV